MGGCSQEILHENEISFEFRRSFKRLDGMTIQGVIKIVTMGTAGLFVSCSSTSEQVRGALNGARPSSQQVFEKLDVSKDGFLTYEEFQARQKRGGVQALRQAAGNLSSDEMAQKRFAAIDTNSDQRISAAELAAAPQRRGPRKSQ